MIKEYYLITLDEIGEIIDLTEDSMLEDKRSELEIISRKRIDLINIIKTRLHVVHEKDEPIVYEMEDIRFVAEEPPDYEECPCWMPPADPEGTTGTCEGDGGDCKLWYWNVGGESYTNCNRFAKRCNNCLEILCKFRKVIS